MTLRALQSEHREERRATNRSETMLRRRKGDVAERVSSTAAGGVSFTPRGSFTPKITEAEVTADVSAKVLPFSAGQLARASGRSKDTAKCWKAGRAAPNLASAINLARNIGPFRKWLYQQIECAEHPESPQSMDSLARALADHLQRSAR